MPRVRPLLANVDEVEAEARQALEPGEDWIMLPVPNQVYKALSDAAARKNMTVAQLLARAISSAIEEE